MFWLTNILLFLSGAAAASSLITRRFPELHQTVLKINQFKGLLGFVLVLLAVGSILDLLLGGSFSGWFVQLLEILLMSGLGLIQGIGIVKQIVQKNSIIQKLEVWRMRIVPYEEMLGITAMVLPVYSVLRYIF